jgi:hypothetical protein
MLFAVLLCGWSAQALTLQVQGNPIRRIVTLLQDMQKEIEAEGEKEKGMYEKFMCYCDGNSDGMKESAKDAASKIIELKAQLEAGTAEKSQIDQDLIQHGKDREAAKQDLAAATSVRNKERSEFEAATGDSKENLDSMNAAIAALEKGMGKSLMQMSKKALGNVVKAAKSSMALDDVERSAVLTFIQGTQNPFGDYAPASGEIVGMLKAMKDEMDKDLGGIVSAEESAQAAFEDMAAAKKEGIAASSSAIESKTQRAGELAVAIVTTADDVEDTTADMDETNKFLANLAASCREKKNEWAKRSQLRSEEIAAISETIGVLNDDDALDLFKTTLSLTQKSPMGFLQKKAALSASLKARNMIRALAQTSTDQSQLNLISYALSSKKVDFSKVLAMVDNMVTLLGKEQRDDDATKSMCDKDFAESADHKKATEEAIASSAANIAEMQDSSSTLGSEIATLQDQIKALDKSVADATEQRKEEHADSVTFQSQSNSAVQLIEKAKNRMVKFYKPNLYKEAPKRELTDEEKILASSGRSDMIATEAPQMIAGTTQAVFVQLSAVPAPPPETWGAYKKKDGKSNGVLSLMDMLLKELKDDATEAKHDEETAQKDYETLMSDSQASRADKAGSITSKEKAKADLDVNTENAKEQKTSQEAELMNTQQYISTLHGTCDFIVTRDDERGEIKRLENERRKL